MEPIRLIRRAEDRTGTAYFEFLPGRYKGLHWNDGSVFLAEEVFGYIEPTIMRHEPKFDHCGPTTIPQKDWRRIIADLRQLALSISTAADTNGFRGLVAFEDPETESEFGNDFRTNASGLVSLLRELATWTEETLQVRSEITVLGI